MLAEILTPCPLLVARLAQPPLSAPVEQAVSRYLGRVWMIKTARDMSDYACHPCAILSDGGYAVFAKFSDAPNGQEQFEIELAGLRRLQTHTGVLIPTPIGIVSAPGGTILVLEAVQAVDRGPQQWRAIGQALARIHQVKGERFGLETNGYWGPLPIDNTPTTDWAAFYTEQRLLPYLKIAVDSGNLPPELARQVETIITRFPELCGPVCTPTLLHGDAQQNNYISTRQGAVVIDPAVYYGNPEVDLAALDSFEPVPQEVYAAYSEVLPIEASFWERKPLWKVPLYLAAVAIEGAGHLGRLTEAVELVFKY